MLCMICLTILYHLIVMLIFFAPRLLSTQAPNTITNPLPHPPPSFSWLSQYPSINILSNRSINNNNEPQNPCSSLYFFLCFMLFFMLCFYAAPFFSHFSFYALWIYVWIFPFKPLCINSELMWRAGEGGVVGKSPFFFMFSA